MELFNWRKATDNKCDNNNGGSVIMKKIAIIGAGPTGIYTLFSLLKQGEPLDVSIYEQAEEAGVGMPYSDEENSRMMLANIASIEIPPIQSSYLDWLKAQSRTRLARYGVDYDALHDRQFLPRILLGEYFRDQFLALVGEAREQGFRIRVNESCRVSDLQATEEGVRLWVEDEPVAEAFDLAVIATGHVWPDEEESTRTWFPSPWSGLMEASIPPCRVGIMGTSLSGIDAAMAVAVQHGRFIGSDDDALAFRLDEASEALSIALMSRSGILPEADFLLPYSLGAAEHRQRKRDGASHRRGQRRVCSIASLSWWRRKSRLPTPYGAKISPFTALTPTASARRGLLNASSIIRSTGRWITLKRLSATNARDIRFPGATRSCGCMKPFRRWCLTLMTMTGSVSKMALRGSLSTAMPPFLQSLSAGCWRCAKRASSLFSP
ncbi:acyl-CoA dehydrogenase [Klebsiella michiganensis]|uniref:Acyl-CoA dehydrogenase n=1 Tax=Klebsiella michiganensis TaxID=1134687 RepID=A0A7H4MXS6_9ENTR|nr:acyl-CoA dehydrogenase [Klebsiella michiganensis]